MDRDRLILQPLFTIDIFLYPNPDYIFIKEMDDFITCTLRCIIENVFVSTYFKKKLWKSNFKSCC